MALKPDGTVVKKRKTKPKVKAERPEIVLVTPRPSSNVMQATEFELFRMTLDDKAIVAMRVGNSLVMWDKTGYPSRLDMGYGSAGRPTFLDYLTSEEGVYIPGSADERPEVEETPTPETEMFQVPEDKTDIWSIPDGVTYVFGNGSNRWDARNFTVESRADRRVTLLIRHNEPRKQYGDQLVQTNKVKGWEFVSFVDETDEQRWLDHLQRKRLGID